MESRSGGGPPVVLTRGDSIAAGDDALIRTQADSWLRLGSLAGGTFFLAENSEIELRQVAGQTENVRETVVSLNEGRLLLVAGEGEFEWVVEAEIAVEARARSALYGALYEPGPQLFELHCLSGRCRLVDGGGAAVELAAGEMAWVQGFGPLVTGQPARYELFADLADIGVVPTATRRQATLTPTRATATASPTQVTPTATVTATPLPATPTSSPTATAVSATATPEPAPTATPEPAPTATPEPAPTATPEPAPTDTAEPPPPTATPAAEASPTVTPTATATLGFPPTATPAPTDTVTPGPAPTATSPPEP